MSKSPNKGKKGSDNNKKQNQGNATAKRQKMEVRKSDVTRSFYCW